MTKETIPPLAFIRLKVPRLIPQELIENVKGKTFTAEQFYRYQEEVRDCEGSFLFVMVDEKKKIKGFIWAELNRMDGSLFVNTLSVTKEFWHKGKMMEIVEEFLRDLQKKYKCPKVFWLTQNPKFFEKHNWKRSKNVLMEYSEKKEEVTDGSG